MSSVSHEQGEWVEAGADGKAARAASSKQEESRVGLSSALEHHRPASQESQLGGSMETQEQDCPHSGSHHHSRTQLPPMQSSPLRCPRILAAGSLCICFCRAALISESAMSICLFVSTLASLSMFAA